MDYASLTDNRGQRADFQEVIIIMTSNAGAQYASRANIGFGGTVSRGEAMLTQVKIIELIYTHLSMIRETVVRNGNLRAEFFRNIWMVEKVRKKFDEDEISIFRKVYADGKAAGELDIDDIALVADITHYCIQGLEVPFIYGRLGHGMTEEASKPLVAKVVYGALGKRINN